MARPKNSIVRWRPRSQKGSERGTLYLGAILDDALGTPERIMVSTRGNVLVIQTGRGLKVIRAGSSARIHIGEEAALGLGLPATERHWQATVDNGEIKINLL